jgi:hypothetical protein
MNIDFKIVKEKYLIKSDLESAQQTQNELIEKINQLEQDNLDMRDSCRTHFERCNKCKRLHDTGLICVYCRHDNSEDIK